MGRPKISIPDHWDLVPKRGSQPDAFELVREITKARLLQDWPTAERLLAELQRLAERPKRRAGGEQDDGKR